MIKNLLSKRIPTNFFPILILLGISLSIAIVNYVPGTWLSGWDNLHPEFNFALNIKRSIFSLWQEYQGLGLLGGMAHAADLPRQLILYLLSTAVPTQMLRYVWTFLMLGVGPVGVFLLIKQSFSKYEENIKIIAGLVAGIFYLINLATVQVFFTPYESFVSFYGMFPWLLYSAVKYLKEGGKKNLFFALVVALLSTPAFYVQTMFVVYVMLLSVLILETVLRNGTQTFVRSLKLGVVLFMVNAFWLLPVIYFTLTSSDILKESKINSFATIETKLMNEGFGQVKNVALLKGFWFDYTDVNEAGEYEYLMKDWRDHVTGNVETIGLVLFTLALLGSLTNCIKNKSELKYSSLAVFGLSYMMLASSNPPLGNTYQFLSDKIPLFEQMFRSVFTKWSTVAALAYGWGLASLVVALASVLKSKGKTILAMLLSVSLVAGMVMVCRPIFSGKLISNNNRVSIPREYFDLFDYFNDQDEQKRIAFFPAYTFFGWNFYDWGYGGSGFLWYGIKQPILDRAFDVWNPKNETFYHEFTRAIYTENSANITQVLKKYDVTYLLIDESVYLPEREKEIFKSETLMDALLSVNAKAVWSSGFLTVFEIPEAAKHGFLYTPDEYSLIRGAEDFTREDTIMKQNGVYIERSEGHESTIFPFSTVLKEQLEDVSYLDEQEGIKISLTNNVDVEGEYLLNIPGLDPGRRVQLKVQLTYENGRVQFSYPESMTIKAAGKEINLGSLPTHFITTKSNEEKIIVVLEDNTVPLTNGETKTIISEQTVGQPIDTIIFSDSGKTEFDIQEEFLSQTVDQCWTREDGNLILNPKFIGNVLSVTAQDAVGCLSFKLGELNPNDALLEVGLPYRSDDAARPDFCVVKEGDQSECRNKEVFYATTSSKSWNTAERFMILEGGNNYWITLRARPPDNQGETWTIEYQSPKIVSYPVLTRASFSENIWENIITDKSIAVEEGQTLTAQFISSPKVVDFAIAGRLEAYNCDLFDRGSVEKTVADKSVTYLAENKATICDFVPLINISTNQAHLLRIMGEGISGRGMKVHFFNKNSERDDIETLLPMTSFDESFAILPWQVEDDQGYVLNIGTKSFGQETSENRLDAIALHTIPVDWLSQWSITPAGENKVPTINSTTVGNVRKYGTHRYLATTDAKETQGLIVLSQSYDAGWKAYDLGNRSCDGFSRDCVFPWILGRTIEQVKVNSWENGWLVPQGEHQIIILFWPQYLEYLGLLLAGFPVVVIPLISLRKRLRNKQFQTEGRFPHHL